MCGIGTIDSQANFCRKNDTQNERFPAELTQNSVTVKFCQKPLPQEKCTLKIESGRVRVMWWFEYCQSKRKTQVLRCIQAKNGALHRQKWIKPDYRQKTIHPLPMPS